jgi:hypothetical protein
VSPAVTWRWPVSATHAVTAAHGKVAASSKEEVARRVYERLLAQYRVLRQHPVEIGTKPVCQIIGLDWAAEPPRMEAAGNSAADLDPSYPDVRTER